MPRTVLAVCVFAFFLSAAADAQQAATDVRGTIAGTVSTQSGTVMLPGVLVAVRTAGGDEVAEQVSDAEGHVTLDSLPPGQYVVVATLDGFESVERPVTIAAGGRATVAIDMAIAVHAEHVEVVGSAATVEETSGSIAAAQTVLTAETRWFAPGGSVDATLKLLATVIATQQGESINGGRPDQVGFQIGVASLADAGTNIPRVWLPADGVDSVSVLANPYETEFGRFSSGVVLVQTRQAHDRWHVALNNTLPAFRTRRGTVFDIIGLGAVNPSLEAGGPLVRGRLFLEETAQYHWDATDVPSRPESETRQTQRYDSLTRLDAVMSPRHTLVVAGGFDQVDATHATLGTFTPPEATANVADHLGYSIVTERAVVGKGTFVETTLQTHRYITDVEGQGASAMELLPGTTLGNFFNRQHRATSTFQWVETASTSHRGPGGLHVVKLGADLMSSDYHGTSASAPVLIRRSDGTLARRLDFMAPTTERSSGTNIAAFAQDRLQPSTRWYVESGARVDRDDLAEGVVVAPRVGGALVLNRASTAVVRGGYGLFFERTPLVAGAFTQFEAATDARFAADGATLVETTPVPHLTGDLRAARASTWDVAYDYRLNAVWTLHAGVLNRHGADALIVDPAGEDEGALLLSSSGRSQYLQEDVSVRMVRSTRLDVTTSYVHASARENLNTFLRYYDAVMNPIIGADQFAPAPTDVHHRLFVRGRVMPTSQWMVAGTFDWHSGQPWSAVNETLDFVGDRNALRFPAYVRTELGLYRRISLVHAHPWLGVRVTNALDNFLPTDVQANLGSPAYGTFYNSEYRQVRVNIRFER